MYYKIDKAINLNIYNIYGNLLENIWSIGVPMKFIRKRKRATNQVRK